MITTSAQMQQLINQNVQDPYAFALVQLPTDDGKYAASQVMLGKVVSYRIQRTEDPATDSCDLAFADDNGDMMSTNPRSRYGVLFKPGPIDKKVLVYLGYRGATGVGTGSFKLNNRSSLLKFTGYVETDGNTQQQFSMDKTVNLMDLTKQFRFPVNDTFPHALYGDQNLAYFDPAYNLKSTDGITWTCPGKMFTIDKSSRQYGATHIDPAVYVDATGVTPTSTPVPNTGWSVTGHVGTCTNYTFDYNNGTVTFTNTYLTSIGHGSGLPLNSLVSVAGNPTYMAPEDMLYMMFVYYGQWSPNFLALDKSNVLIPQFSGDGKSLWECAKIIAGQTNPRFIPWVMWADENGLLKFYEKKIDGPPVKTFYNGKNMFNAKWNYTTQNIATVVRADGTVNASQGDQPITALAFDVSSVNEFGLTAPFMIDSNLTSAFRHLGSTQAMSALTMIAQAALYQVCRPILTCTADLWPDWSLQISDKVIVNHPKIGMNRVFTVKQLTEEGDAQSGSKQQVVLEEFYETINMALGAPSGVSVDGTGQASTTAAPSSAIIGAVRLGTNTGTYAYRDGDMVKDKSGRPIIPAWNVNNDGPMNFDVFFNSLPGPGSSPAAATPPPTQTQGQWGLYNLPPQYTWQMETDANGDDCAYCLNDGSGGSGYILYVGQDNIFYRYVHRTAYHIRNTDKGSTWNPPANTLPTPPYTGGTQTYTGTAATVWFWHWWYLCLDSNAGTGKFNRPIMRVNQNTDGAAQAVPATGGLWVSNAWSAPPGPVYGTGSLSSLWASIAGLTNGNGGTTKLYGNLVVNVSDYTTPPPGFVGANVMGDGTNVGVAYGNDAPNTTQYVNYQKQTRGYYCVFAANGTGARQYLRIPFDVML